MKKITLLTLLLLFTGLFYTTLVNAQGFERLEPEFKKDVEADSPYKQGLKNGIAVNLELNDFGFALGTQYRRGISFGSEIVFDLTLTALKDEREQQFQNYWGMQIIPNKYNRVFAIPVMVGFKQRYFAQQLSDDFRIFTQTSVGGTVAFVYPYFDDSNGDGFIDTSRQIPYDVFQGMGDGSFQFGFNGLIGLGVDFGPDFKRFQSVRFSYAFHYFPEGIQIMEPNSPNANFDGFDKGYFFGTPSLTFKFGNMW